jgi:hypothetical protein
MNARAWLNGIDGIIPGGISPSDFAVVAGVDSNTAERMLYDLVHNDIGRFEDGLVEFADGDKIKAAIHAVQRGASIEDAAVHLSWKDFEGMTAHILEAKDFTVSKNYTMTKPRMEIDVIGIRLGIAILIDCKHWQKHSAAALGIAVEKQIERTKHYVAKSRGVAAAPVIVTLYQDKISFINKVPIVPIFQLSSFIDEFYGNLEDVEVIRKESQ